MGVALFVPGCFPATAGAIVYDTRLASELRALGYHVTIVPVAGQHPMPDDLAQSSAAALWAEHRRREPTDTAVIDGFCLYAFAPLAEKLHEAGAIGLVHHLMSLEPQLAATERADFARIESEVLPQLGRIVAASEATAAKMLAALPLPPEALAVVTPGIAEAARSDGSGSSMCHLLAIGSLIPRKGHDTVLRALVGLPDLAWHLTICGDDELDPACAAELCALSDALGLSDRVTFAGACLPDRLETLWRSADIFVSGSRFEGYGMAVAEAVRRGLPLALTQGAAATEVIPMDGCVLVEPGDHVQMSKALRRLVFSAPLRRELAEAAWQAGRTLPKWPDQARRFAEFLHI